MVDSVSEFKSKYQLDCVFVPPRSKHWVYCRYSDADKQDVRSIQQQVMAARELAARGGHEIPDDCVFADEGVRGWILERPELNRLIKLLERFAGCCTDLYVFGVDRMSRDAEDALYLQKLFSYYGVRVHYIADGMMSDQPNFQLNHIIKAAFAEEFGRNLGANTKRGQRWQMEKGCMAGPKVYGYDHIMQQAEGGPEHPHWQDADKDLVINSYEAAVVRMIYRLYQSGLGYNRVAQHLNKEGFVSPRKPTKHTKRLWRDGSVRVILSNIRYTGVVLHGVTQAVRHPETRKVTNRVRPESEWKRYLRPDLEIIPLEEFETVQRLRKERDKLDGRRKGGRDRANGVNPWSGLLHCPCGGHYILFQPGTYKCAVAHRGGNCKNHTKIKRDDFGKYMLEVLVRLVRESRSFEPMVDSLMAEIQHQIDEAERLAAARQGSRDSAREKLTEVDRRLTNLVLAFERNPDSSLLDARLRELEAEKKLLVKEIEAATPPPMAAVLSRAEVSAFLSDALENLHGVLSANPEHLRDELHKRVQKLVLVPITFEGSPAVEITGDLALFSGEEGKMLCSNGSTSAEHLEPKLDLSGVIVKMDTKGNVQRVVHQLDNVGAPVGQLRLAA